MDDDERNLNDDGAPIIEEFPEDTTPEKGDFDDVLNIARAVTYEDPNFMDDVLLGKGKSFERNKDVHEVFDRLFYLSPEPLNAEPIAYFIPEANENPSSRALENSPSPYPEHNSHVPSPPHSSPPPSVIEAGDSHTSLPPRTSTSEAVALKTTPPSESYS
ncbi:hypothetical protein M5689_024660 [Euphorbia peplus]|nr:hypothetical protein M5689_024660 [Euphorbia peplus]